MKEICGELLAPAGDMACLKAAIAAGADAVYLGGQKFGARAFAGNFSDEELTEALQLAHFFGKKIYLTINTLTKETELEELIPWLSPFYEAGLDGVIIQDLGVLERCRRAFPEMELHASTQMTVTDSRAALFLKSLGVCRVVPARELSLEEIRILKRETGMELETFIHGALCYCYSGQCLFSSILGGRSGNRGRCAQPCRLPYSILEDGKGMGQKGQDVLYPLSLKDLCVLPFLPGLLEAGIDSFKIEGRMKSPEYVAGVTAVYRKYIDLYRRTPEKWQVEEKDLSLLSQLYVRSETGGGYYDRHNGREMITLQKPGYSGCSEEILEDIRKKYPETGLTRKVNLSVSLEAGKPAVLYAKCGNVGIETRGAEVMPAQKRPLARADVEKQLKKTGGSHFETGGMEISIKGDVFLPVSALNDLRRQALSTLWEKMAEPFYRILPKEMPEEAVVPKKNEGGKTLLHVSALTLEQAKAALEEDAVKRLYVFSDAILSEEAASLFFREVARRKQKEDGFELFLTLPVILRAYSERYLERLARCILENSHLTDGFLAGNLSGLVWAKQLFPDKKRSLGQGSHVFNRETLSFYQRHFQIDTYTASPELNRHELSVLPAEFMELSVYGRIPMMVSAGCVKRTAGRCTIRHTQEQLARGMDRMSFQYALKDRCQARFPVLINCRHCMNTIYNSVPLSLHQYLPEIRKQHIGAVRLDFTDETLQWTKQLIRYFASGEGMPPAEYTTGHFKKGVQ